MSESRYLLDRDRREALRRLRNVERLEDPATIAYLERIGVAPGWRCLEAGAGAGSVARWLGHRVGESGKVLAVDLKLDLLDLEPRPNVECRRVSHDLMKILPGAGFRVGRFRERVGILGAPNPLNLQPGSLRADPIDRPGRHAHNHAGPQPRSR